MKHSTLVTLGMVVALLSACARPPMTAKQVQYKVKANEVLGNYAHTISKGITRSSNTKSRGATYYTSSIDPAFQTWYTQNGGTVAKQNISAEVQDCVTLAKTIPVSCNNYQPMLASLARCLDRIVSERNPLYSAAYRGLDVSGQQYYTYLLDWRRPQGIQTFGPNDFSIWYSYALNGYVPSNVVVPMQY